MATTAFTLTFAALLAAGIGQIPTRTNQPPRPYVDLPIPPNVEEYLKSQLFKSNENKQIQDLLGALRKNPDFDLRKFNLDKIPGFDPNDPVIRDKLKQFIGPDGPKFDLEKLKGLKKAVEDRVREIKENPNDARDPEPTIDPAPKIEFPEPPQKDDNGKWIEDFVKQAEDGRWGDLLKESPAFQKAILDMQKDWGRQGMDPGRLEWMKKLKLDGIKLPEWRPKLDGLGGINLPRPPMIELPQLPNFGFGAPKVPALPSGPSNWSFLAWAPLILVGIVAAWLLLKQRWRLGSDAASGSGTTIDPSQVSSRDDFLRAFEQLALVKIGPEARTWNHVAASHDLETATGQAEACRRLGRLYEAARYSPPEAPLSEGERDEARRLLTVAAGATAA